MTTRNWYSDGYDAYNAGQPKMRSSAPNAGDFNAGWSDAEHIITQDRIHDARSEIVARICDQDGELDVDALAEVLHDLGVRGW